MLVDERQRHCVANVFESESDQGRLNDRTEQTGCGSMDKDRINGNSIVGDAINVGYTLSSMEKVPPNCGIFEYKYQETVENVREETQTLDVSRYPRQSLIHRTWTNRRIEIDDEVDEDEVQEKLQKIIDDAILDPDWLNSNIPSDSESSIDCHVAENGMDVDSEEYANVGFQATNSSTSITKLINGAELLVSNDCSRDALRPLSLNNSFNIQQNRTQQWISQQPDSSLHDSCDASGELTTGESDVESNTSDKAFFQPKYSSNNSDSSLAKTPTDDLRTFSSSTPKFKLRGKKFHQNKRPWSIAEVDQIYITPNTEEGEFLPKNAEFARLQNLSKSFSSSESTLHHPKSSSSDTAVEGKTPTNPSCDPIFTSSLEETVLVPLNSYGVPTAEEDKVSSPPATSGDARVSNGLSSTGTSSLKRKKAKFRRKSNVSIGRRNLGCESDESSKRTHGRVENHSQEQQLSHNFESIDVNDFSPIKHPSFFNEIGSITVIPRSDMEKNSTCRQLLPRCQVRTPTSDLEIATVPEDISSLSEQAWDSYQDSKYLSEPYSEDVDHDGASRLQDFGDDYSKYFDSNGSPLIGRPARPNRINKLKPIGSVWSTSEVDSESDPESINQMLNKSKAQLYSSENAFRRCCNDPTVSVDLHVIITKAETHLEVLKKFISALQKEGIGLEAEMKEARGIVRRWEALQMEAEEKERQVEKLIQLQKQLKAFRNSIEEIDHQCEASVRFSSLDTPSEFQQKIKIAKKLLSAVTERSDDLTSLNHGVHSFLSNSSSVSSTLVMTTLKDDLTNLYQFWDDIQMRINGKISKLEAAQTIWQLWQEQKKEMENILKQDSDTLEVLERAIQSGDMTDSMASNAQDVSRLLNERLNIGLARNSPLVSSNNTKPVDSMKIRSRPGGYLSDSGTSGYESCSSDDLSERERRLAHLRRLARNLEATLDPQSNAYCEISKTIFDAEKQLCALQKQCQELIVRTTGTISDDNEISLPEMQKYSSVKLHSLKTKRRSRTTACNSWIWRIVRTAIPFHVAILLLLCVAYLLEPNCCDSANTLNFNLSPQLRFINGPPPV